MPSSNDPPHKKHDPNIMRHAARPESEPLPISPGDDALIEAIEKHLERYVGPYDSVFHEIVSPHAHIDIHHVRATKDRPCHLLCTSGCAERPMTLPEKLDSKWSYAEVCCVLPEDWRLDQSDWSDERWYFPIRWLKQFARLPHEHSTWIYYGHSMPNGDPARPMAPGVPFCGCVLTMPDPLDPEFFTLNSPDREVHFWMMIPLLREEMDFKLASGMEALEEKLDPLLKKIGWQAMFDPKRPNACGKRKLFGFL